MLLTEMFENLEVVAGVRGQAEVTDLSIDSRKLEKGMLFYCQRGRNFDGHDYARAAIEKGACALVVDHWLDVDIPQVLVKDVREALALSAARFFGNPAKGMRIVGVTGTKGKTTTTYLIKAIFDRMGWKTGLIGTVSTKIGDREIPGNLTTPETIDFHRNLRMMRDEGIDTLVMEVSANAITLKRIFGVEFEIGVFSNFTQDHLDFYGTMENYFEAKAAFFKKGTVKKAIINIDDDKALDIAQDIPRIYFGVADNRGASARDINMLERGMAYTLAYKGEIMDLTLNLPGLFNVYNSMAAAVTALEMGCPPDVVEEGLESVASVPGRIELVETGTPFNVILDYAHSPASLESILKNLRNVTRGRLIALFGCGGDRDREKRPVMGKIAGELADFSIITSDNPRNEDPMSIIGQIEEGISKTEGRYMVVENRREAIMAGLMMAEAGDTLILAGKGHETYQEIKGVKKPFDERAIVKELVDLMKEGFDDIGWEKPGGKDGQGM
ncbi:MAG: UDP-N-acetylmuramoyl-L-alanyl-D-glutamate--2,6-diaminopimelate ligase [Christensenellales bacterium]